MFQECANLGGPFRTVQEVRIWSDHSDAGYQASVTKNAAHNRIWKPDACLHMFGAFASRVGRSFPTYSVRWLYSALQWHPCQFVPLYSTSWNRAQWSSSVGLLLHSGERLVCCKTYSVAWVPRGVVSSPRKRKESWGVLPTRHCQINLQMIAQSQSQQDHDLSSFHGNGLVGEKT